MTLTMALPRIARAIPRADASILPLRLDGVSFSAGGTCLIEPISVAFAPGATTVILGPNGAGKSLLLRLCHGLIRPTGGAVSWASADARRVRREQAMVFQKPVVLRRSAAANLDYALAVAGVPRSERARRVAAGLAQAGLSAVAHRAAHLLSGGQQQRLAIVRAWLLEPQILFLDEPTANLDPAATRAVEEMIVAIGQGGTKIVMTTHDLGQSRRLADEVLFLHRGCLVEQAPASSFFAGPRSREAAAFLRGELFW